MTDTTTMCESIKLRLIAAADGLLACTKTAGALIPLQGAAGVIAIGPREWIAKNLGAPAVAAEVPAGLLHEILALAETGMCHGLTADDYCSQIVAKIKSATPLAPATVAAELSKPTDISQRLRQHADTYSNPLRTDLLAAAGEIERYYGGMMNWKRTAEAKDAAFMVSSAARDQALEEAANAVASTNTLGMTAHSAITKLCAAIRALRTAPSEAGKGGES